MMLLCLILLVTLQVTFIYKIGSMICFYNLNVTKTRTKGLDMARRVIALVDTEIKSATPKEKDYTLSDGNGLQLLIKKDGTKLWEFYYIRQSTQKRAKTSFGVYPIVTLKNARDKRAEYQKLINDNIDPIEHFKDVKLKAKENEAKAKNTIGLVLTNFFKHVLKRDNLSPTHQQKEINRLNNHFIQHLSKKENTIIENVTYEDTIKILEKLEALNQLETLQRVKMIIVRLFEHLHSQKIFSNPELFGTLKLYKFKAKDELRSNPTYTKKEDIKKLYNDMLNYKNLYTKYLMILSIHTAQRQGSLIKAKWSDINFDDKIWSIPKEDMKGKNGKRKPHFVPLSDSLIVYLKELYIFTGGEKYLFPNTQITATRNRYPYISNNTVTKALRTMGHTKEQQTAHGLRAQFKTVTKDHQESDNLKNEFVERVLAHKFGGTVEETYNRADNIKDMRVILNWWSAYLESLRD